MSASGRPVTVSRSAFLDLRDEERLVHTGYQFLDEKRVQLASEILRQRDEYRGAREIFLARCAEASAALIDAAAELGIDALQVQPAASFAATLSVSQRPFIGMELIAAELGLADGAGVAAKTGTAGVVQDCIAAFDAALAAGVPLAALTANLERLLREYQRTERRVRALENVILPEIRGELAAMEEGLDLNDQEEVIRVHTWRS